MGKKALGGLVAGIVARVSTVGQRDEGTSLDVQVEACLRYAEEQGYTVSDEHIWRDTASGISSVRAGLSGMLGALERGEIDIVLVYNPDRLARSPFLLVNLCEQIQNAGGVLKFLHGPSGDSDEDKLMMYIVGYGAQQERMLIARRTMSGKRATALKGRMPIGVGGAGLYGYDYDPVTKTRTVNEIEAVFVRLMYQWCAEGRTSYSIALELNERDIPTKRGGDWYSRTVDNILRHTSYKGLDIYGKYRCRIVYENRYTPEERRTIERTLRPESEWILIEGFSPVIVDVELWEKVQRMLDMPKARTASLDVYVLTGFSRCARCGSPINGASRHGGVRKYRCRGTCATVVRGKICTAKYIEADEFEETVFVGLADALRNPAVVLAELEEFLETGEGDIGEKISDLNRKIQECRKKEARFLALFGDREIDQDLLKKQVEPVKAYRDECESSLAQLEKQRKLDMSADRLRAFVEERCRELSEGLDDMDFQGKKALLGALGVQVVAVRGEVSITMTVSGKGTTIGRTSASQRARSCPTRRVGKLPGWMSW